MMDNNSNIDSRLKEIKQSFRLQMNGVAAQSMRDKGLDYHVNWGVSLPALKAKAAEIGKDYDLALALWKDNVRECKILATLIMSPGEILPEVVDIWMEQTDNVEIAEQASLNLYQHLPFAAEKAYRWIASESELYQICGYHVLSRLFMRGQEPNERGANEFIDQALAAIQGDSVVLKKAAWSSVLRFADLGDGFRQMAQKAMKSIGVDL